MGEDGDSAQARQPGENKENPRRGFLRWALGVSVVLLVSGVAAVTKSLWTQTVTVAGATFPRLKVANISNLKQNEPVTFNYPLDNEPNLLVKLGQRAEGGVGPDGDIVAFSEICQHLGCIYSYLGPGASPSCNSSFRAAGPTGYCCCHGGVYDLLQGGKVIGGPPPRPVPQVSLQFDSSSGDIYAVGMGPPTIFGHNTGSSDVSSDLQGGTAVA